MMSNYEPVDSTSPELCDQYARTREAGVVRAPEDSMTDETLSGPKAEICRRLIEGESLRKICATEGMPSKATVCRWLAADTAFAVAYAIARDLQAETLADEIQDIADTPLIGVRTTTKGDGTVETVEGDMIDHRRLQVDVRKWIASKQLPKKYGNRMEVEVDHKFDLASAVSAARARVIKAHDDALQDKGISPHGKFIENLDPEEAEAGAD